MARFLFGNLVKSVKISNLDKFMPMTLRINSNCQIQIFCHYQLRTDLLNLILAKVTHYMIEPMAILTAWAKFISLNISVMQV